MLLGVQGIDEDGMARLVAFLRVGSEQLRHRWQVASDDSFDALLVGDDETLPMFVEYGPVTLRLVEARSFDGEPGQLCRPLAFDALMEQLGWAEGRLTCGPRLPQPIAPVVEPSVADAVPAPQAVLRPGDLYHLDRLPAPTVLGTDRRVLAVASLLTLRAVRLEELVAQSGMSEPDCESALIRLKALGVLQAVACAPAPVRERTVNGRRRAERVIESSEGEIGVIARWRGRLGLGGR